MIKVFLLGSGVMAQGIAQTFLENNFEIIMYKMQWENSEDIIKKLKKNLVEKAKYPLDIAEGMLSKLKIVSQLEEAEKCDFVIEAIIEDINIKKEYFKKLDKICKKEVILATNTSSLSITDIASSTRRPEKVVGMHFFNPVPLMKLVEIIKSVATSEETINKVKEITVTLQKEAVVVDEVPGFVVNRLLIPMINEAIMLFEQNVATVEDIDNAMKLGANHPIGPLALADLIGNDVVLKIMDILLKETGDSKYRSSYLLRKYVSAGMLGRKTKKGFYNYN